MEASRQNIRIQKWVVVVAILLLGTKLAAYFLTHSVAILTDALESIVNLVAGLFGLYSLILSAKPRDEDHPYGHGKIEFISAGVEGTLILIAGILIISEAVRNLFLPHALLQIDYGIALISSTALVNFVVGAICIRSGKKSNSLALVASGKHLQSDTYSTIGIIIGLLIIYFTNLLWVDSAVAILFGLIIIFTGSKIVRGSVAGIMDESDKKLLTRLVQILNQHRNENWIDLHNLRVIKFGSVIHMDTHLTVPWYLNVREAHVEIDDLAAMVRDEFGESLELFVHSDGCMDFSCKICDKKICAVRKSPFERKIHWTVENIIKNDKHNLETQE